jgi:Mg-chelatase subunit ChlI
VLGAPPFTHDLDVLVEPNASNAKKVSAAAVSFAAAWRGRKRVRVDGMRVPFLGAVEMRRVKRAVGRAKDRADLALLDEVQARSRPRAKTTRNAAKRQKRRKPPPALG